MPPICAGAGLAIRQRAINPTEILRIGIFRFPCQRRCRTHRFGHGPKRAPWHDLPPESLLGDERRGWRALPSCAPRAGGAWLAAMEISASALVCSARPHGEVGVVARLLTERHGLVAAYVAGGRGRQLRPVLIPGNAVAATWREKLPGQLPSVRLELAASRAPFLAEPLPAAAIAWATALTAAALPERHAYPALYAALSALLDAVCHAPSARGWVPGLIGYEALMLRELGYGRQAQAGDGVPDGGDWAALLAQFDRLGAALARYVLAERRGDVMGARDVLRARLGRIGGLSDQVAS